ncbi:MAG: prepilin peptidase [Phycisphaeraceae bacterium]|nr:prepilin peptidase [Phycisphaeraceae bacterium]
MHDLVIILPRVAALLFVFAFGACVGSLINVLAYRLPRGIGVVTPPSRCPACETKLRWKDNIPIFGWLFLRGRCRYCKTPISPEYPLVELFAAVLFAAFFVAWYLLPTSPGPVVLGIDLGSLRPDWTLPDRFNGVPRQSAPMFAVVLLLLGSLLAMTLTDLKTTMIPLALPWFATLAGLIIHTGYAAFLGIKGLEYPMPGGEMGWRWSIPTHGWATVGIGLGGTLGLGVSMLLLRLGLIRRSFADALEWEEAHRKAQGLPPLMPPEGEGPDDADTGQWRPTKGWLRGPAVVTISVLVCAALGAVLAGLLGHVPGVGLIIGAAAGPIVAGVPLRLLTPKAPALPASPADGQPSDAEVWIAYPHARREMVKEMAFLAPPVVLALVGLTLSGNIAALCPLWLDVLGGVLTGYLVGGGVVWAVRLFGSLGFGKEAMGLGDVHLMAAVGACVGWADSVLAFFGAAFVGIVLTFYSLSLSRGVGRAMPYGPSLAIATVLVLLAKPAVELGLSRLTGQPVQLP